MLLYINKPNNETILKKNQITRKPLKIIYETRIRFTSDPFEVAHTIIKRRENFPRDPYLCEINHFTIPNKVRHDFAIVKIIAHRKSCLAIITLQYRANITSQSSAESSFGQSSHFGHSLSGVIRNGWWLWCDGNVMDRQRWPCVNKHDRLQAFSARSIISQRPPQYKAHKRSE